MMTEANWHAKRLKLYGVSSEDGMAKAFNVNLVDLDVHFSFHRNVYFI